MGNNNMAELGEQIDGLNKMKGKAEKDKAGMERDLQEARATLDESMRERAMHERNGKLTQGLIVEAHQKLDEMARALNEADSSRKKLQVENQDLTRQIEETEAAIAALGKNKISLPCLSIPHPLGVLQLSSERDLVFAKGSNGSLSLLNLAGEILVLNLQLLPGGISLIQGTGHLVKLLVSFNNQALSELAIPLMHGSLSH